MSQNKSKRYGATAKIAHGEKGKDWGFCIECGDELFDFSYATKFCYQCRSNPSHKSAHRIVYELREEVGLQKCEKLNDDSKVRTDWNGNRIAAG